MSNILDNYLHEIYIQEEIITEGKVGDFFKNNMDKLVYAAEKALEKGMSSITRASTLFGILTSAFVTTVYKVQQNIWFSEDFIKEATKESNQEIKKLVAQNSETLSKLLTQSRDLAYEVMTNPSGIGLAIILAIITALMFAMQLKTTNHIQAKKKVRESLKKNDKLDKNLQRYCNRLADEVYS